MKRNRAILLLAAAALTVGGVATTLTAAPDATWSGADWYAFGGDDSQAHFSPLTQINAGNVSKLGLAWYHDLDTFDSYTSPLEVGGVVYFAVGHSVIHALDARTGKLLWQYDPDVANSAGKAKMRAGWGIRGIAYKDGKIFTGTRDGRLIAVGAKSGKLLWSVQTIPIDDVSYITGPPFIAGDKVMIGFGGADYGPVRGYVTAYDINSGKQAWRFYVVPGDPAKGFENKAMEAAAKTWKGEWWKLGGGGAVFHAMAYDAKYHTVYLGTGNGWPWNQKIRSPGGGDNLYLGSIVALDADTGEYKWHYQVNPGMSWDYNDAMDIELTDLMIDGKMRSVIVHAPKNGFFYVIDRETGKLISADKFAPANWASHIDMATGRPVENPDAHYADGKPFLMSPWPTGAHSVQSMAHSKQTGLTYIPAVDGARVFVDPPNLADWKYKPGGFVNTGLGAPPASIKIPPAKSFLLAYNPVTQKPVWKIPQNGTLNGGVIATGGNLVFQGQNTGEFSAFAADTGKKLWAFDAQDGILANAITYTVAGKQYVTVITGFRSSFANVPNWDYRQQKRRVLTFMLGGTKKLPAFKPVDEPIVDDPGFVVNDAKAAVGAGIFGASCVICHGAGMVAGGAAPDLRKSAIPTDAAAFAGVVREGVLMPRGMPSFTQLTDDELEGLRHYIRLRARATMPKK